MFGASHIEGRSGIHVGVAALAALLLAGCGQSQQEKAEATEPPKVEDTVFGDTVGAMDKARGVEAMLRQDKEATDRAIEQAEAAAAGELSDP